MITLHDLDEAIMECQGQRDPDANTCIKLAAFYTIREHLFPIREEEPGKAPGGFSYSPGPEIVYTGDSDFAEAVSGKNQLDIFPIIDELMETLSVINPRLYANVMRRLE